MRPKISTADVVRAFQVSRPRSAAEKRAILEVLGFAPERPLSRADETPPKVATAAAAPITTEKSSTRVEPGSGPLPVVPPAGQSQNASVRFTLSGPRKSDVGQAPWSLRTDEFEPSPEQSAAAKVPVLPLFTPRWTRAILSTALGVQGAFGSVNLAGILNEVARGRPLRELPRLPGSAIASQVHILLDVGQSMMPFADDQRNMAASVRSVVCADGVRVLKFVGSPLRGAGTDADATWPPYSFPASGTHVLLLTDLGIGAALTGSTPAQPEEWGRFSLELRRRKIACTAFVPYPMARWPLEVRRVLKLVQWDRATTAGSVKFSRPVEPR